MKAQSMRQFVTTLSPARTLHTVCAILCLAATAAAAEAPVALGSASTFGVLAGTTVTNVISVGTTITGDVGTSPGTAITGFPPGIIIGNLYAGGPVAAAAEADLVIAYDNAAGRNTAPVSVSGNLGGMTLFPGLYKSTSSLEVSSGDLTLDAQGDPTAVFIFQMASTLTTTNGRQVFLIGGAQAGNVFWQVGSSATLGTTSVFKGNILAAASITITQGASLEGRALAINGAVTLDANSVTIPIIVEPSPTPTESPTPSPTESPTPSPSLTASPTESPTPSPTESPTPSPSLTASPTESPTASPTESPTPSPSLTASPTESPTPSPSLTASPTVSLTPSPTASLTPTASPTLTATASPTPSLSPTASPSLTASPTVAPSATVTLTPTLSPSPTPSVTPTPPPCLLDFDFPEGEERWTFTNSRPPYHEVIGAYNPASPGTLDMTTTTNKTSFAYWESPLISPQCAIPCPPTGESAVPGQLYRATWTLFSDQTDPTLMPVIRLRTSAEDFARSDLVVATAYGDSSYSPTVTPRSYTQYFLQPEGEDYFRLDYDLLSFTPSAGYHVMTSLDRVTIEAPGAIDLPEGSLVRRYDFVAEGPREWTSPAPGEVREIPLPAIFNADNGLKIQGVASPSLVAGPGGVPIEVLFGYWGAETDLAIQGGTVYRLRWSVTSNAALENRAALPTFRFRVNESSLKFAALVNIDSVNQLARVPLDGVVEDYDMWFLAPPEIDGRTMILSFDYLYVNKAPTGSLDVDDPTRSITLNALEITALPLSLGRTGFE